MVQVAMEGQKIRHGITLLQCVGQIGTRDGGCMHHMTKNPTCWAFGQSRKLYELSEEAVEADLCDRKLVFCPFLESATHGCRKCSMP